MSNKQVLTGTQGVFQMPDYSGLITDVMIQNIRKVDYFAQTQYANLDLPKSLSFYTDRYVKQLYDFTTIDNSKTIVDVGAGFGWLSMAFAFSTSAKIIAVEPDEARLDAGKQIAQILGLSDRIEWRTGSLEKLPTNDNEADVVYCIEVLEHVYKCSSALQELCRTSKDLVIFTTPNLWFPVIAHDTRLPFCHWLPIPIRKVYAKFFNRDKGEIDNLFWSPYSVRVNMKGFKPVSKWLHYSSYQKFLDTFPFYLPYGTGSNVRKMGFAKKTYYNIISKLGLYSHWFAPSLACVYKRKSK